MTFRTELSQDSLKFIAKQQLAQQKRIMKAIAKLPYQGDIKKLANTENKYRLRVGDFRIIYTVKYNILTILVLKIGNRGDVYK